MTDSSASADRTYPALCFQQRGPGSRQLVLFHAPVGELVGFAKVDELTPRNRGPQREQKEARVQGISRFLEANTANTIPTALILAFRKDLATFARRGTSAEGILTIRSGEPDAATIVDGQHRLYGIAKFDPRIEVAVVGLLDSDEVESAFQFLVINNKSSKVPATHTKALLAKFESTDLANRLKGARLAFDVRGIKDVDLVNSDPDSPFYESVDWPTTPETSRLVQATAIELSLSYIGGLVDMDEGLALTIESGGILSYPLYYRPDS